MAAKLSNIFPLAKFLGPHRPEISVAPQKLLFFGTRWTAFPFVFVDTDIVSFKTFFFYLKYVNAYSNRRITFWCNSSWLKNLANDDHSDAIFYKKLPKKNLLQNLVTFWWQKKLELHQKVIHILEVN